MRGEGKIRLLINNTLFGEEKPYIALLPNDFLPVGQYNTSDGEVLVKPYSYWWKEPKLAVPIEQVDKSLLPERYQEMADEVYVVDYSRSVLAFNSEANALRDAAMNVTRLVHFLDDEDALSLKLAPRWLYAKNELYRWMAYLSAALSEFHIAASGVYAEE